MHDNTRSVDHGPQAAWGHRQVGDSTVDDLISRDLTIAGRLLRTRNCSRDHRRS
jgi:hypothetical protein